MLYQVLSFPVFLNEIPFHYSSLPSRDLVFEISLKTPANSEWLREIQGAHRLVQTLLQGHLMGQYQLLDFLIWPEGLFVRLCLKETPSLGAFLGFLKERSIPSGESAKNYWDDELQWIKLVAPDNFAESSRSFLEKAEQVRGQVSRSFGFSPSLFFFYRDPRLNK